KLQSQEDVGSTGSSRKVKLVPSDHEITIAAVFEMLDKWGSFSLGSLYFASDRENFQTFVSPEGSGVDTTKMDSLTSTMIPKGIVSAKPFDSTWPFTVEALVFQPHKSANASPDEINFCLLVRNQGPKDAIAFAYRMGWECERPLRDLREIQKRRSAHP